MPAINAISPDKLLRLIGTPACPALIDVRPSGDFVPGSVRRAGRARSQTWAAELGAASRRSSSAITAASGAPASPPGSARPGSGRRLLEGGAEGWAAAGLPLVREAVLPPRDAKGRTRLGHARAAEGRPDRLPLADPPLRRSRRDLPVRRAGRGGRGRRAVRRGAVRRRGRVLEPSRRAVHVRRDGRGARPRRASRRSRGSRRSSAAPTPRGPSSRRRRPGLLAVSLGLSRMYADDLEQLEAGMLVYDAFYRWCRDAVDETHDWVSHTPEARVRA